MSERSFSRQGSGTWIQGNTRPNRPVQEVLTRGREKPARWGWQVGRISVEAVAFMPDLTSVDLGNGNYSETS